MPRAAAKRFVYLGPEGTFAEQALRSLALPARASVSPSRSVPEALEAVRTGEADAALVPLENSVGGAAGGTPDEPAGAPPLVITPGIRLPVRLLPALPP